MTHSTQTNSANGFATMGLRKELLQALESEGYTTPTPIQSQAIPYVLAGRDVQGIAQTGTGKTAAFALPILQRLADSPRQPPRGGCRVLVLSPTRELASQICDSFRAYGKHMGMRATVMFGGVPKGRQARAMANGVDILVATPGRLIDHMQDRTVRLDLVEILVLDEADHMLDLGFIIPIRRIVSAMPAKRQTLFFSATMPNEIGNLAGSMLKDPAHVAVTPVATTAERIEQAVIMTDTARKRHVLFDLLVDHAKGRTLVFTRTKHGADKVVKHLIESGIPSAAIHGNKSQPHVDDVGHVINYDLPNVPESYVHRIGRTARAGADGMAISLCAPDERAFLKSIEKLIRSRVPVIPAPGQNQNQSQPRAA